LSPQPRSSGRLPDQLRPYSFETDVSIHAEGSCLVACGNTRVFCTASVEDRVPGWLKGQGRGWVTAEYGMLPRATGDRMDREAKRGQSGRTMEIQRLIGRALRAAVDLKALGEVSIKVDCDVLQADGGTRTASVSGGYVALVLAIRHLQAIKAVTTDPLRDSVAAVSCGLVKGQAVLDLDYVEDSAAEADANFVLTGNGGLVEVQATAEDSAFPQSQLTELLALAAKGCAEIKALQDKALAAA